MFFNTPYVPSQKISFLVFSRAIREIPVRLSKDFFCSSTILTMIVVNKKQKHFLCEDEKKDFQQKK